MGGRGECAFLALNSSSASVILQICIQINEFFKKLGRVVQERGQLGGVSLPVGV